MMGSCRPGGVGFVALWRGKNKAWADQTERAWGGADPISAGDRGVCTKRGGGGEERTIQAAHTLAGSATEETVHLTGSNATCCCAG